MNNSVFIVAVREEVGNVDSILGHPVIFSGVGKINSAIAAAKAVNLGFKNIINVGSCGSLKYEKGTILKVGKVYQDIDLTPLCSYGETLFESDSLCIDLFDSPDSLITTDYFIDLNQKDKYSSNLIEKIYSCSGFDMECYSIAKVCRQNGVKFNSIKWVSDSGDSSDWIESCKIGFEKVKIFLENEIEKKRI